jgi:HJR/Mrr/RecB family endonuclease
MGELIRALAIDPLPMQTLDWRDFESLIAELLRRLGYEITLTRGSKDDGIDIYASRTEPIGQRVLFSFNANAINHLT